MKVDERTRAQIAVEQEAKGYLTPAELWEWVRPYTVIQEARPGKRKPRAFWSKSTKFYMDGRIKSGNRWVGRWFVQTEYESSRERADRGWRVHPRRAFDMVYLQMLHTRMQRFQQEQLDPVYAAAEAECRRLLPEGGTIYHGRWEREGRDSIHYHTVRIPSPNSNESYVSFGSDEVRAKETHPLKRLGEEQRIWEIEAAYAQMNEMGATLHRAAQRTWNHGRREGIVQTLLLTAIYRHLPTPRYHFPVPAVMVQVRVLNTVYYFVADVKERQGWTTILTLVDGEENRFLRLNFQQDGPHAP